MLTKNGLNKMVLYSEYQPLVNSCNQSIFAYEALMRNTREIPPLALIKHARNNRCLYQLDTKSIENAVIGFPSYYLKACRLFINIFPSTLINENFESFLNTLINHSPWIKEKVVFEINEDVLEESYWNLPIFIQRLSLLKSSGFGIAFDDVALTKQSLKRIQLLAPNYVKLDHTFAKNLSQSRIQQQLISFILEYTNENLKLVLEGIETKEDLLTAKRLGVLLLQGFHFAKSHRLNLQNVN